MSHLPYTRTLDEAKDAAHVAGRRTVRATEAQSPALTDQVIASLALSDDYTRAELIELARTRLLPVDRDRLKGKNLSPDDLVDLLGSAGITPRTTMVVLHADGVDATDAARLMPTIGIPTDEGISLSRSGLQWA